jgi:copper chaperone CopZ
MIIPEELKVGEYREAVQRFELLYPRDQFDWSQPDELYNDTPLDKIWCTKPRYRLWSKGKIDENEFAVTSLSSISVAHRVDGDLFGVVVNYLSNDYHQQVLFPDDFDVNKYLESARQVSDVAVSLEIFNMYPLHNAPDEYKVTEALEKVGVPKQVAINVAREAAPAAYIIKVLTEEPVNPSLLEI